MAKRTAKAKGENTFLEASSIFTAALVVVAALAATVVSLGLILDNYDVGAETAPAAQAPAASQAASGGAAQGGKGKRGDQGGGTRTPVSTPVATAASPATTTDTASVSASSVVAVLTPVIAGIAGIAGLFFGISATGSARGREAEAEKVEAEADKVKAERELVAEIGSPAGGERAPDDPDQQAPPGRL